MRDEQGDKIEHKQKETGGNKEQRIDGTLEEKEDVYENGCTKDKEREPARCSRCIKVPVSLPLH